MAKFEFKEYMDAPSKEEAQWDADNNGFSIIVGTTSTTSFGNSMDKAGMKILQFAKLHIRKDFPTLEMVSYDGDENYKKEWLTDAQLMKLEMLTLQIEEFINEYPFTGEAFTKWARTLMRPMNSGKCQHNMSWVKKNGIF